MESRIYPEFSVHYPLLLTTIMKRPVNLYPQEIGVVYRNPQTGQYFRFTWQEWYDRTCRLANALKGPLGVLPGQALEPGGPGGYHGPQSSPAPEYPPRVSRSRWSTSRGNRYPTTIPRSARSSSGDHGL